MKPDLLLLTLQNDMLVNILNYASDIGRCSERITVQIREIIGARIVALFELNPMGEYRLLAACPERRADFFSTEEGRRLIASAGHFTQAASLEPGHGEAGEMLAVLGMKESYVVPLRVGEESFGLLILLDLMDDRGAAMILEALHDISGVLSLVFKNSYLYRNMESLVEVRTKALQESEERFKALHNASFGGIVIHDQGVILECNQGLSEISGFGYDELIGMDGLLLIAEQSRETVITNIRSGWEKPYEVFGVRKNGEEYPLRLEARKIPYKGVMVRAVEFRDITEQKQTEEALIRQQRIIQLNNHIANVFLTSSQDEVFTDVLDVILAALDSRFGFFGYIDEAGDLVIPSLTRDVWDQCQMTEKSIVFPRTCWSGLWGRSLMEQQTLIANANLRVPQGHMPLENVLATPIVSNNNLIGQFVVANKIGGYDNDDRDLLESVAMQTAPILFAFQEEARQQKAQEKLEAQLHQAQKMESVGRLAGGVAHDFNNMLGVILGYTELAKERVEPNTPLHTDLEKIQEAAQRSADLTRQLLAFARKQTVSPKVIDLNSTIESMLKLLRRLIGEDIDLAWQPGKEVWPVKMDPTQVDQILTNLCVNARDAIVDTGKVTIETGKASFDEEYCAHHAGFVPGEYVLLAVSDNGCGMDEETQAHLFEPFFTTKEVGKGTGLGLAMVYGVVKQNNGFINVYSELGQGTTFKIYLPRHLDKTVFLPKNKLDKPSERGHETILLVEDEPAILEMSTIMLERLGYTVLAAGTPGEAIRLAQEHPGRIDLLLTDVIMPEMNGRDLAKNLLSIYPDIRRLFMSGYTASVIAHHGVLDQGVHFIHKPFSMKDLGEKLREALEG
jgi:PAS domain S-box-containing protein